MKSATPPGVLACTVLFVLLSIASFAAIVLETPPDALQLQAKAIAEARM